jgi:hypothetical protein
MITTYLLCEGSKNSFDRQILFKVKTGVSGVEIQPMGGKFGSGAYLQGFLGGMSKMPSYLTFRDRDFDADVPATPSLTISPYLPKHNGNDFPFKTFYKDAIKHFDYTQFPDFVELRNLIIILSNE